MIVKYLQVGDILITAMVAVDICREMAWAVFTLARILEQLGKGTCMVLLYISSHL